MKLSLKSLKNLTDNYHKADYKSGGNYQTSYYKFLEEGGTRPPEVRITHLPLTCEYILSTTSIPFTIDVRTHNKIVGDVEVTTTLGESSHTSYQLSNESYTFTFNANSIDVADRRGIEFTFTGLNKFEELVTYTLTIPYVRETDCYSLACESNSNAVAFKVDSKSIYAFSINGRTYQVDSLSELQRIAEDSNLKISFYRKPLEWGSWNVNSEVTINELGVAKYTGYKTNTEAYYDSFADFDLTDAVTNSLQDPDMHQWQGFIDALTELIPASDWEVDIQNQQIKYTTPSETVYEYIVNGTRFPTATSEGEACRLWGEPRDYTLSHLSVFGSRVYCDYIGGMRSGVSRTSVIKPEESHILGFNLITTKIITNVNSTTESIALHAENYINQVANSIFETDTSKQFVKLSNILEQFEQNKVLRG